MTETENRLIIEFKLTGAGWMDIRLTRGAESRCLEWLSYLTLVLDDCVRAALQMSTGARRAEATFELEPGLRRLICEEEFVQQGWTWRTTLKALTSKRDAIDVTLPDDQFDLDWQMDLNSTDEFASAVLEGAKSLEAALGYDGYATEWIESPFPVRAVAALEAALAIDPLPPLRED